jgi:hypothetical protein
VTEQPSPQDMGQMKIFHERLEAMPDAQRTQMLSLLQAISQPPESMVEMFERINLRWKREYVGGEGEYPSGALIIDWKQFMAAEKELQLQGPILKRLLANEFGQVVNDAVQVDQNGQVLPVVAEEVPVPEEYIVKSDDNDEGVFG